LRRILVVTLALGVLAAAAVAAYAASSPDQSTITFSSKKAGTKSKPVPIGWNLSITGSPGPNGERPAISNEFTIKIYGMTVNEKNFPSCSLKTIANAKSDTECPKKALVASGTLEALLGSANDFSAMGEACDPLLDVWNSGQGKLTYYFVTTPTRVCLGGVIKTGDTPPYPGTYSQQGKYFVSVVKVPASINYPVAGLVGSLQQENLAFKTQSTRVHGKTVLSQTSIACKGSKRPYSVTVVYATPSGGSHTEVISKSAPC
jgi:hypothetical protein